MFRVDVSASRDGRAHTGVASVRDVARPMRERPRGLGLRPPHLMFTPLLHSYYTFSLIPRCVLLPFDI